MSPSSALTPFDCGSGALICNAGSGYDGPTGVGTPNGLEAFQVPAPSQPVNHQTSEPPANTEGAEGTPGTSTQAGPTSITVQITSPSDPQAKSTSSAPSTAASSPLTLRLTALRLTGNAIAALRRGKLTISTLAFSFTASTQGTVRARLYREVRSGHLQALGPTLQFHASKGSDSRRLHGLRTLAPGHYRLVLTPLHGAARAMTILIL
jgi:hypothetical protein